MPVTVFQHRNDRGYLVNQVRPPERVNTPLTSGTTVTSSPDATACSNCINVIPPNQHFEVLQCDGCLEPDAPSHEFVYCYRCSEYLSEMIRIGDIAVQYDPQNPGDPYLG